MSLLFSPIALGGLELPNRIAVSPMCQYSARDGVAQPWHWQHIGSLALSGAGLVTLEASAVEPIGRITPGDLGIWGEPHKEALTRLVADIRTFSPVKLGIQLAHAGRKASCHAPWVEGGAPLKPEEGAWTTVAPSAIPFAEGWHTPEALDAARIARVREAFVAAAKRADACGFELVELHGAHGYLLHEFISPISNRRTDGYGGPFENRIRLPLEIAEAVRAVWPREKALGMRLSATDWVEGGVTPEETAALASELKARGLDYVCISSGGNVPAAKIPWREPGYQTPLAEIVKAKSGIATMAVGMIVDPAQAEEIMFSGKADMVALARGMLDDPRWGWHAAAALGEAPSPPVQYERAAPKLWPGYRLAHH